MLDEMIDKAGLQSEQVKERLKIIVHGNESHARLYKNVSLTPIIVILLTVFPFERENIVLCSSRLAIAGETDLMKFGIFFCMNMFKVAVAVFKSMIKGMLNVDEFVDSEDEEDEDGEEIGEDKDLRRNEN